MAAIIASSELAAELAKMRGPEMAWLIIEYDISDCTELVSPKNDFIWKSQQIGLTARESPALRQ